MFEPGDVVWYEKSLYRFTVDCLVFEDGENSSYLVSHEVVEGLELKRIVKQSELCYWHEKQTSIATVEVFDEIVRVDSKAYQAETWESILNNIVYRQGNFGFSHRGVALPVSVSDYIKSYYISKEQEIKAWVECLKNGN